MFKSQIFRPGYSDLDIQTRTFRLAARAARAHNNRVSTAPSLFVPALFVPALGVARACPLGTRRDGRLAAWPFPLWVRA